MVMRRSGLPARVHAHHPPTGTKKIEFEMTATKTQPATAGSPDRAAGLVAAPGASRRVWRCSTSTLVLVTVLMVVVGLAIPAAAVISLATGITAYGDQQLPVLTIICGLAAVVLFFGWRLGLHPRLTLAGDEVEIVNPFRRHRFDLAEITVIRPGGDGLQIGTPDRLAEAWCVQKPGSASRTGRQTRADRVCDDLHDVWAGYHLPEQDPDSPVRLRFARPGEAELLTDIERSASLARLGHIFPPEQHPYPNDEVCQRWREVLDDRTRLTLIAEVGGLPAGYACYGEEVIQHLGVAADFQRQGVGTALLAAAEDELFADLSTPEIGLWVLEANQVARDFYARAGWSETGESRTAEFPPYPAEIRMYRRNPHLARRGR